MSQIFVVKSLEPVASNVDDVSKLMADMGAVCMAFHVRVHLEVVFFCANAVVSLSFTTSPLAVSIQ